MTPYRDLNGDSGIAAFHPDMGSIDVPFKHGGTYRYSAADVGQASISEMVRLANVGDGLNTFVNQNQQVKKAGRKAT
jgi:hypothetical protein